LGPLAAFVLAPTDGRNYHPFKEIPAQLGVSEGESAQGIRSQAKSLKTNNGTPIIWEEEDGAGRLSRQKYMS
jgi:hypothetical protein